MLFQIVITGTDWIIGISLMFGLAFVMTFLTYRDFSTFMIFLTMFNGFVVYGGLLPVWTLILNLVMLCLIIIFKLQKRGGGIE